MYIRKQPEHFPVGDPCGLCNVEAAKHRHRKRQRVYHPTEGDPCQRCGLPAKSHAKRSEASKKRAAERSAEVHRDITDRTTYIGIDGEGQGREEHRYVMLAASTENGDQEWVIEAEEGKTLSTVQCLDMILSLPMKDVKVFSYSFNYDLTKILTDLDDKSLYYLFRPELRQRKVNAERGPWPVRWRDYSLNVQGTKFTVSKGGKRVVIWDLFRFFGTKFTNALKDWKVGDPEFVKRMEHMKDKRADFDKEDRRAVREYCLSECRSMAELGKKLVTAHIQAGITLKSYYGAGSSGAAMLESMGIQALIKAPPVDMVEACAAAFFGGRFENSVVGPVHGRVHGWDISSAYPYQLYFLPCLQHGTWELTEDYDEVIESRTALVRYVLRNNEIIDSWAPFPFRTRDGSISYPRCSGGGWIWKGEYLAGERAFSRNVEFREAWVYHCDCKCKPFAKIAEYYVQRLLLGKDGKGIVLKLGCNSCYGKLAQSVGRGTFNSWIWAGLITSGCRAQILELLYQHEDMSNALMIATDGLYTKEDILAPKPIDTGTALLVAGKSKPLGGWEHKEHDRGVFIARPGIYFPLSPTIEDIKEVRGRGVGKGVVLENWQKIVDTFEKHGASMPVDIANVSRFCGAKTSISHGSEGYKRANGTGQKPRYGQWVERRIQMSFDPMPKRERVLANNSLELRAMPENLESMPYQKALYSLDDMYMLVAEQEIMEQPDADLVTYES